MLALVVTLTPYWVPLWCPGQLGPASLSWVLPARCWPSSGVWSQLPSSASPLYLMLPDTPMDRGRARENLTGCQLCVHTHVCTLTCTALVWSPSLPLFPQ